MKKVLVGMFALAMCLGLATSCNQKGDANKAAADSTKVEKKQEAPQARAIADIVKDAKEKGANWSVDEWKASFREMMIAVKPMMTKMADIIEQIKKDPTKADELSKLMEDNADFEKLMDEYEAAANASENGKKVSEDKEFEKQLKAELGIPDL